MRILFTVIGNSRRSNYLNGNTIRLGGAGASGTDGSSILIAEYLASQGHEVVIAVDKLEPPLEQKYKSEGKSFIPGMKSYGVIYTTLDIEGVENKNFDILINSLWFQDYDKLPVKITKAVIYWCHMQWIYGIDQLLNFVKNNNLELGFVNISNWERSMNKGVLDSAINRYSKTKITMIPNPVMTDIVEDVLKLNPIRNPHKFSFHASWPRGGNISVEAVRKLGWTDCEFHAFDYLMTIHDHGDSFFKLHNGVDKNTLFKHLAESEYFVYPLYTPYQDVHKDTFSCVVAEAIALGVIVITYPLGALPEYFNDYCVWLDFPDGVKQEELQLQSLTKDLDGKFKCTDNIVKKIKYLEQNPQIKENIRSRGKDYIVTNFNVDKVGSMWIDFINKLLK